MVFVSASVLEVAPALVDPMARVSRLVAAAASDASPVLLVGETGSGKGYQAARIHARSVRARAPFVHLFAAALGPDAFDSTSPSSVIGSARGGVLFIDEVEELSPAAQGRLLQYLEAQARRSEPDVRILAATTCDPDALATSSCFRRDLFFLLTALMIVLPPLRTRRADIGALARTFIEEAAMRVGRLPPTLTADAEEALTSYAWPGNVRQLRGVLNAATMGAEGSILRRDALWLPVLSASPALPALPCSAPEPAPRAASSYRAGNVPGAIGPRLVRGVVDRSRVAEALARTGGNQSAAALYLGISRRTLINRIEQFGIPRPRKG